MLSAGNPVSGSDPVSDAPPRVWLGELAEVTERDSDTDTAPEVALTMNVPAG